MNNTEMMETLAIQTNEDAMTIESILKATNTIATKILLGTPANT